MTFEQVREEHVAGQQLVFKHPDLRGFLIFDGDGELIFIDLTGHEAPPPLWFSDFDRDDWIIIPNED